MYTAVLRICGINLQPRTLNLSIHSWLTPVFLLISVLTEHSFIQAVLVVLLAYVLASYTRLHDRHCWYNLRPPTFRVPILRSESGIEKKTCGSLLKKWEIGKLIFEPINT